MWTRTTCVDQILPTLWGPNVSKRKKIHYTVGTSHYDENGVKHLNDKVKMHTFGLGLGDQNDLFIFTAKEDHGKSQT